MYQVKVIVDLFPINYRPIKYKFSENMNSPQIFVKTTILATNFDVN